MPSVFLIKIRSDESGDSVASHAEKMAALQKAEAGSELNRNEQHALNELAKEHSTEGFRAQRITGDRTAGTWGILS